MTLKEEAVNSQELCHLPLEKRSKFEDFWAATWLSLCECYSAPEVGKKAKVSFSGKPFQEMQGYPRWIQHCTQPRQLEENCWIIRVMFLQTAALHTHKGTEDQGHVEESAPDPAAPGSSQETDQPRKHSLQVEDLKLGTQRNGAPAPAPPRATQHSPRGRV